MKKISTYLLMGIEVVGIFLIHAHRYMQMRALIYLIMACIAIVYFVCEFALSVATINSIADILCDENLSEFTDEDWKEIEEITKEINKKANE